MLVYPRPQDMVHHRPSPGQPKFCSASSVTTINAQREGLHLFADIRPSLPANARFPAAGYFSRPLPWGYLVAILVYSEAPACPMETFRSVA
jgi:hypothetical protein